MVFLKWIKQRNHSGTSDATKDVVHYITVIRRAAREFAPITKSQIQFTSYPNSPSITSTFASVISSLAIALFKIWRDSPRRSVLVTLLFTLWLTHSLQSCTVAAIQLKVLKAKQQQDKINLHSILKSSRTFFDISIPEKSSISILG